MAGGVKDFESMAEESVDDGDETEVMCELWRNGVEMWERAAE